MKAVSEQDADIRYSIIVEAARQCGLAKDYFFTQLNIVMDFGEVARSVEPELSLFFHNEGKRIIMDPKLQDIGDNPFPLYGRTLKNNREFIIDGKEQKLAWIKYQRALDHLAMLRKSGDLKDGVDHKRLFEQAKRLDSDQRIYEVYVDQLAILDSLRPGEPGET